MGTLVLGAAKGPCARGQRARALTGARQGSSGRRWRGVGWDVSKYTGAGGADTISGRGEVFVCTQAGDGQGDLMFMPVPPAVPAIVFDDPEGIHRNYTTVGGDGRVWCDLAALAEAGFVAEAAMAADYHTKTMQWRKELHIGGRGDAVVADTVLFSAVQVSAGPDRKDLGEELAELLGGPTTTAGLFEELTSADPNLDGLAERARELGGILDSGDKTTVELPWSVDSDPFGGAATDAEIARRLKVEVVHAKWRDRRARRLARVEVWARQLWPVPTLRVQLAATTSDTMAGEPVT